MIWLIFTGMLVLAEGWYDSHLHALKKRLIKMKDKTGTKLANNLMHSYQMPLRAVYFVTLFWLGGGGTNTGTYFIIFAGLHLSFFWLTFDLFFNAWALNESPIYMSHSKTSWERKYFGWMTKYGYFALKAVLFGAFLYLAMEYRVFG